MSVNATTVHPIAGSRLVPRRLLSDERLMRLAASGESSAFTAIFERFHQQLYRYCRAILSDHDEAQDALQNTMTAALRALPGEEREIALRPWLYRIAHNEAISIVRRRPDPTPVIAEESSARSAPGTDWAAPSAPSAHAGVEDRERLRELVQDLTALPERQRSALVMRELSGLGYAEIASALDAGEPAARQVVYEAREAMRELKRGREMDCSLARQTISERDGRMMRGRALRAHLRGCEGCQDFRAAISQRGADLQLLSPPLSALAASSVLGAVFGQGAGGGGAAATLGAGGAGAGGAGVAATAAGAGGAAALTKGGAVLAALVVGAGAAGATSAVDLPLIGSSGETPSQTESGAAGGEAGGSQGAGAEGRSTGGSRGDSRPGAEGRGAKHSQRTESSRRAERSQAGQHGRAGERGNGSPALGAGPTHELPPTSQGSSPPGGAVGNPHSSSGSTVTPPRSESGSTHPNAGSTTPPDRSNAGGNGGNPSG